jgi:hypothetical protein
MVPSASTSTLAISITASCSGSVPVVSTSITRTTMPVLSSHGGNQLGCTQQHARGTQEARRVRSLLWTLAKFKSAASRRASPGGGHPMRDG